MYLLGKPGSIAGDSYAPLISLWNIFKNAPDVAINDYHYQWNKLQNNRPRYFYYVRERFNENPNPLDLNFLCRTCVNGIIRFNSNGKFNNSFHLSRPGMSPSRFSKNVMAWHDRIRDISFVCQDYRETLSNSEPLDFVYLDPPYAASKNRYNESLELDAFYIELEKLNSRNVHWMLSFDGKRGAHVLTEGLPTELYLDKVTLCTGQSPVSKVLEGTKMGVYETLYMNYQ